VHVVKDGRAGGSESISVVFVTRTIIRIVIPISHTHTHTHTLISFFIHTYERIIHTTNVKPIQRYTHKQTLIHTYTTTDPCPQESLLTDRPPPKLPLTTPVPAPYIYVEENHIHINS